MIRFWEFVAQRAPPLLSLVVPPALKGHGPLVILLV